MALIYSTSAPNKWLIDSNTKQLIPVTQAEYDAAKAAASGSSTAPSAPAPTTAPAPVSSPTPPPSSGSGQSTIDTTSTSYQSNGWSTLIDAGGSLYVIVANGQVMETKNDLASAKTAAAKYGPYDGKVYPSTK